MVPRILLFLFVIPAILSSSPPGWCGDCERAKALYGRAISEPDYGAGLPLYEEAVRLCPGFPEAWNNLADTKEKLGRIDDAIADYQKALSIKPDFDIAFFSLGDIYLKQKAYKKAIAAYWEGLKINPQDELAGKGLKEAESGFQASGGVLSADYIGYRLSPLELMGPGGTRSRLNFQNIYFDFDSAKIKPESNRQLNEIGKALKQNIKLTDHNFQIAGHTDSSVVMGIPHLEIPRTSTS